MLAAFANTHPFELEVGAICLKKTKVIFVGTIILVSLLAGVVMQNRYAIVFYAKDRNEQLKQPLIPVFRVLCFVLNRFFQSI